MSSDPGSLTASTHQLETLRKRPHGNILEVKTDVMANWLYQQQLERFWTNGHPQEGVVLKKYRHDYACYPETLQNEVDGLLSQVTQMNVRCAMTVNTPVINIVLQRQLANYVPLTNGLRLQLLPSMRHLVRCQQHQFGAFIKDQLLLVVWDEEPQNLLIRAEHIERSLIEAIWNDQKELSKPISHIQSDTWNGFTESSSDYVEMRPECVESGLLGEDRRPTLLISAVFTGLTLTLLVSALGFGWRSLGQEIVVDGIYSRAALLILIPFQCFVSLFFMQVIIINAAQIIGPVNQLKINTKYFSGKPPRRLEQRIEQLPHITIQLPVYKEGLRAVIKPTITSLKTAVSTYELQGGTANIFVNDDGLQLVPEAEAHARCEYYAENNIGWVARPPHKSASQHGERVFVRRGKFKKASNMNYALMMSNKVEDKLALLERRLDWSQEDETRAYDQCLSEVLEAEEGRVLAQGTIRIGDYILLVDADTRVPPDCLLDAVSEMEQSPEVGILQFSSGVMQVTESYFEAGIAFFTNLIYAAICYAVAAGDVSPFVGHNAILRWSALQQVSYTDEDGYEKFWSESHVSEDFDMSLRLQIAGYIIRLASYTGDGFKEGVSLTVYDELNRWEKYAFGCNELLFYPLRQWVFRGPFTPLFHKFLMSDIRLTSKITILAYIGTYYALGAAWILTLVNYFLIGWYNGYLDTYYLDSFKVYFSLIILFSVLGNISLAILRYRLSEKSLLGALYENFKWLPLLSIFLGGVSFHISQALLYHFLEIDMTWGATGKEVEYTTFFEEMPKLLERFKGTLIFCFTCAALMVVGATVFPAHWSITDFVAIYPLSSIVISHFLLPVALNPALMMFRW